MLRLLRLPNSSAPSSMEGTGLRRPRDPLRCAVAGRCTVGVPGVRGVPGVGLLGMSGTDLERTMALLSYSTGDETTTSLSLRHVGGREGVVTSGEGEICDVRWEEKVSSGVDSGSLDGMEKVDEL